MPTGAYLANITDFIGPSIDIFHSAFGLCFEPPLVYAITLGLLFFGISIVRRFFRARA